MKPELAVSRFLAVLEVVAREADHLAYSRDRVFAEAIDTEWVNRLANQPELAERLEAFVSRYSRLQDTIAGRLLPRLFEALAEEPGSQLELLNRAARLGMVSDVEEWLAARALRNRLVHEYMEDPAAFAQDLRLAREYADLLINTYSRIRANAQARLQLKLE